MKTILISAGDLSGERHAAGLVRALRVRIPDARFVGMGGEAMAAAGVELSVDQRELAVGGLFEIFGSLPRVIRAWRGMIRCLRETQPDLIVLVDSGGFNLPLARRARVLTNAKILYYVAPQVWAWRSGRMRRLAARTDRIAVILPFEPAFYAAHGISVDLVGHPAVDALPPGGMPLDPSARQQIRASLGIEHTGPVLGLFPGSRRNELERHLPIQLDAFACLREREAGLSDLRAIVALAPNLDVGEARRIIAARAASVEHAIHIARVEDGRALDACDVALVKPGTITVELMLRRMPMVVMGRVHALTAWIARRSLHVAWLSMPNLIANAEIVPELLQGAASGDRIAAALAPLFEGDARARQIEALDRSRLLLGEGGVADRVAAIVEEMIGSDPA